MPTIGQVKRNRITGEVATWTGQGWDVAPGPAPVADGLPRGIPLGPAPGTTYADRRTVERDARSDNRQDDADARQRERDRIADDRAERDFQIKLAAEERQRLKDERDAAKDASGAPGGKAVQKNANLKSIVDQINRVQTLYDSGIRGQGLSSLMDYLPTNSNAQFNSAAAGLAEQGLAAFRVPGVGSQSDTELRQFVEANKPSASDRDVAIEEKLRTLRNRVGSAYEANGLAAPAWEGVGIAPPPDAAAVGAANRDAIFANAPTSVAPQASGLATGPAYSTPDDIKVARAMTAALNAGASFEDIDAIGVAAGLNPIRGGDTEADWRSLVQERAAQPGLRVNSNPRQSGRRNVAEQVLSQAAAGPMGTYFSNAADSLSLGLSDEIAGTARSLATGQDRAESIASYDLGKSLQADANPMSALAGQVSGALVPGVGLEMAGARLGARLGGGTAARAATTIGADGLFGAAYGAGQSNNDRLGGAGVGALGGAAGGAIGRGATGMFGRGIAGVRNASVRALADRNIPLTLGQMVGQGGRVGQAVKGMEDRLAGLPVFDSLIGSQRRSGYEAFNRAAFDEAGAPIGRTTNGAIGEAGVDVQRINTGDAYTDAVTGVRVQPDQPFVGDMGQALNTGRDLPTPMADNFNQTVAFRASPAFETGELTGEGYQALRQGLRRDRVSRASEPFGPEFGQAVRGVEGAAEDLVRRQAPEVVPALNAADQSFRLGKVVESAVERGKNTGGVFSPAQLGLASTQSARRFGNNAATTQRPFFELQRAGQDVLPSNVPDSGTAGRAVAAALLPAVAGGTAAGFGVIDPSTAAALAALGLPYTGAGQRMTQAALLGRSPGVRQLGERVLNNRRIGGMFGAGLALPLAAGN